jgi:peptidoglycan/LPS O-acetylase OafA/YrhL
MQVGTSLHIDHATDHAIEALRGLAALMVVVTHYIVFVLPQGQGPGVWGLAATGVDLFFVLSGLVFTRLLAHSGWSVVGYGLRRFFRLYPLYLVALLTYALLRPADGRWDALPAHLAMLHTYSLKTATAYNVAFWSLPPEVEFYLLLPLLSLIVAVLARLGGAAMLPLLATAAAVKISLVAMADPGDAPENLRSVMNIHAPGLMIEFLLGSAAAVWGGHAVAPTLGRPMARACQQAAGGAGLLALLVLSIVYSRYLATPEASREAPLWLHGVVGLWAATGFAAIIIWLLPVLRESSRNVAWSRVATWAGRLSYGIYLFHNAAPHVIARWWPSLGGWALLLSSLALTLLAAAILHLVVEWPARRYGRSMAIRVEGALGPRSTEDAGR